MTNKDAFQTAGVVPVQHAAYNAPQVCDGRYKAR